MFSISIIKCFVITIIILFESCLSSSASSGVLHSNARHSDIGLKSLTGHTPETAAANSVSTASAASAATSGSIDKASCSQKIDCAKNSFCDNNTHRCRCNSDYVSVLHYNNGSRVSSSPQMPKCLQMAKLDDPCLSSDQCVVNHSTCLYVDPGVGGYKNASLFFCKCRDGYHSVNREEMSVTRDNQKILSRPVCAELVSMNNSWIGTFAIVCIVLLVVLIGGFIGIIRFQRWKQRPLAATVTSLAAHGHTPHLMSSSPPPMGSVEAEFQNDFIQVFPMHHLEPLPDKNTPHEYVIK